MTRVRRDPRYAGIKEYPLNDIYPSDVDVRDDGVGAKDMGQDIQELQFPRSVSAVPRAGRVRLAVNVRVTDDPAIHQVGVPEHRGTHIVEEQDPDEEHRDRTLAFMYE